MFEKNIKNKSQIEFVRDDFNSTESTCYLTDTKYCVPNMYTSTQHK